MSSNWNFLSWAKLKGSWALLSQAGAFQLNRTDNMYVNKQQILVPNQNCNQIS